MLSRSIRRCLAVATFLAAMFPTGLVALERSDFGGLPTLTVDGVICTLSDAIRAANGGTVVGGCAGSPGIEILVLDADVVLTVADTTHSTLLGGAHAGLPDITSAIILDAGAGGTIERDPGLACGPEEVSAFRIFNVPADGSLYLFGLTLRNGCVAPSSGVLAQGGAIHVEGGELELHDVTLEGSSVYGIAADDAGAAGGALYCSGGSIPSVRNAVFRSNLARGVDGQAIPSTARGGAGAVDQCSLGTWEDSVFESNVARASSEPDGFALGGALDLSDSTWERAVGLSFSENLSQGGSNTTGSGGGASGGAITITSTTVEVILDSTFRSNQALAGSSSMSSGARAEGGAIHLRNSSGFIGEIGGCVFENNFALGGDAGPSSSPGDADGGALKIGFGASLDRIHNTLFGSNQAQGGVNEGVSGGTRAQGGAIQVLGRIALIERSTFVANQALGGAAAVASALGGAISIASAQLDLIVNSSFVGNRAVGGTDNNADDPGGPGRGGAIDLGGGLQTSLYANTFVGNEAQGGSGAAGSGEGLGGAVLMSGAEVSMVGNLLTGNLSVLDDGTATLEDCRDENAVLSSSGFNRVESPGNCTFAATGDQTGAPTSVYPLADWGCTAPLPDGTCLPTVAIDQSSAATDQGSCSVVTILDDAREVVRPFDLPAVANGDDGCDVGAFEAVDIDGDGFTEAADCAPQDPAVHAIDLCGVCGGDSSCVLLVDGFESGDASSWSTSVP